MPSNFPQGKEATAYSYQYLNFSDGPAAAEERWASGPTLDGNGTFTYHDGATSSAPMPPPVTADPRLRHHVDAEPHGEGHDGGQGSHQPLGRA